MNKVYVSRPELRRLFERHGIWTALRQQGSYSFNDRDKVCIPIKEGHQPMGGMQVVHKWKDTFGRHVITTHAVIDSDGWPIHWDEKDLIVDVTKYIHKKELDVA